MGLFFIIAFTVAWLVSLPPALAQLGLIEPIIPWEVGILIGLAPAVAATVGWLVFGELLVPLDILGMALVAAALLLAKSAPPERLPTAQS